MIFSLVNWYKKHTNTVHKKHNKNEIPRQSGSNTNIHYETMSFKRPRDWASSPTTTTSRQTSRIEGHGIQTPTTTSDKNTRQAESDTSWQGDPFMYRPLHLQIEKSRDNHRPLLHLHRIYIYINCRGDPSKHNMKQLRRSKRAWATKKSNGEK